MFENLQILINNILGSDFIIYYENAPLNLTASEKEQWATNGIGVYSISGGSWQLLQGIAGCEITTTLSIMLPTEDRARFRVLEQELLNLQQTYNGTITDMTGTNYSYVINFDVPRMVGDVTDAYGTFRQVKEITMNIVLYTGLQVGNNFAVSVNGADLGTVLQWDINSVNALVAKLNINDYALTNFQQNNELVLSLRALVKDTAIWGTLQNNALNQVRTTYNVEFTANGITKSQIAVCARFHIVGSLGAFQVAEIVFAPAGIEQITVQFIGNGGEWAIAPRYSISYVANGGTGTTIDINSPYVVNSLITVLPCSFTKSGYAFLQWTTAASGGTVYNAGDTITATANITLYAQWTTNNVTIAYDGNGGTSTIVDNTLYNVGDTVVVKFTPTPTRSGYGFAGWATTTTATYPTYSTSGTTTLQITQDTVLYAVWAPIITVTFNGNGGNW